LEARRLDALEAAGAGAARMAARSLSDLSSASDASAPGTAEGAGGSSTPPGRRALERAPSDRWLVDEGLVSEEVDELV
ncbi:unnamed protein product, partial [Heterosigma akashiwo]